MNATPTCIHDITEEQPIFPDTKKPFYSLEQLALINPEFTPRHIAIIPDGNRRWAMRQEATCHEGHQHGADIIIDIVKASKELGVKAITFYTFSTENWKRPQEEIDALMWLIETYLIEQRDEMVREGICLHTIGELHTLPHSLQETIRDTKEITKNCHEVDLILAINYGGRNEIVRAFHRMIADCENGDLAKEDISEAIISQYLDTSPWSDPDLLIRTSGENRISNFLIWQLSYTEIHVTDTLWPDFNPQDLYTAILEYQNRERRMGY